MEIRLAQARSASALQAENLYELQRQKNAEVEALKKVIGEREDEVRECQHENRRLFQQGRPKLQKLQHKTKAFQTTIPDVAEKQVQNTAVTVE